MTYQASLPNLDSLHCGKRRSGERENTSERELHLSGFDCWQFGIESFASNNGDMHIFVKAEIYASQTMKRSYDG